MTLFYSGIIYGKYELLEVNNQLVLSTKKFTLDNDRISHIRLLENLYEVILTRMYSSTETSQEDIKIHKLYDILKIVYNGLPRQCINSILEDFISQIGRKAMYKFTIGNESIHDVSINNITRLVGFAIANIFIVSSNFFPRKNINKYTLTAQNGVYQSQIDHVPVDKIHRSCINYERSKKGFDGDSGYFLAVVKVKLRIIESLENNKLFKYRKV